MFNSQSQDHWDILELHGIDFKEKDPRKTNNYRKLMETDYYDVALEDRIHAVMEERGLELFEDDYEDEYGKLQEEFILYRDLFLEGEDFSEQNDWISFAKGAGSGIPCGASHISSSKTCRIDGGGPNFSRASEADQEKLKGQYADFEKAISGYSPEAQAEWKKLVNDTLERNLEGNTRYQRTDEQATAAYYKIVKAGTILATDGPPTKITDRAGNEIDIHPKLQPYISEGGRMMWKDPAANNVFTKSRAGQMELKTMKEQLADDLRNGRVEAAVKYYDKYKSSKTEQAKGEFGSVEHARQRVVSDKEVDSFVSGLTKGQRDAFATSGLDLFPGKKMSNGEFDPRAQHSKFFYDDRKEMDNRMREAARSYLQQTPGPGKKAISPFTGRELDIPGTPGPGASVIDHHQPISKFYPSKESTASRNGAWSKEQGQAAARAADTSNNMVFVERGLNQSKGNREDWNKITSNWGKAQAEYDKRNAGTSSLPSFTSGAPGGSVKVKATRTVSKKNNTTTKKKTEKPAEKKKTGGMSTWSKSRLEKARERAYNQGDEAQLAKINSLLAGM